MSSGPASSQGCFCGQMLNPAFSLVTKENWLAGLPRWELPPIPRSCPAQWWGPLTSLHEDSNLPET